MVISPDGLRMPLFLRVFEGEEMYKQNDNPELKAKLTQMIHDIVDQKFDSFKDI